MQSHSKICQHLALRMLTKLFLSHSLHRYAKEELAPASSTLMAEPLSLDKGQQTVMECFTTFAACEGLSLFPASLLRLHRTSCSLLHEQDITDGSTGIDWHVLYRSPGAAGQQGLPDKAASAKQEGNRAFFDKDHTRAIAHYSRAIRMSPTSHFLYTNR